VQDTEEPDIILDGRGVLALLRAAMIRCEKLAKRRFQSMRFSTVSRKSS